MPELFESYDDLDDVGERLKAADPAQRRVAIIELGNSGDPAAVALLNQTVSDPDAGVRQQVVASAAAQSLSELKDPASADALYPLAAHSHAFVRMATLRALKELRRKD